MKLIIEKLADGSIHAYRATAKHFRKFESTLAGDRLEPADLDHECNLDGRGPFHIVFDVKGKK